jgi:hypothetical protein
MPPCVISDPATYDDGWIPAVRQAGLAIISRDKHIASRAAEKEAVLKAGARSLSREQLPRQSDGPVVVSCQNFRVNSRNTDLGREPAAPRISRGQPPNRGPGPCH